MGNPGVEPASLMSHALAGVQWALESITTNKASGGDGIPVELFQILSDAVKVLHSICQQIWKTQQWLHQSAYTPVFLSENIS